MNLCFFYPKLICGPKIISVSTFVIVWRELAATTQGVDSWHIWETLPGKMCIAAKHNVCASFCDLFSRAICKSQDRWNHDARKLVWLWHCSQYLENSSPPRSKNGCPTVHPEWARNARRWLNKVRGHNRGKKTIFKAKKGKNAILAWGALIRRRLFSCTRFCAFHISFISHASCIHDKSITSNVNNISLLQFILSNQGIVNAVVYSCRHYISLLSDWWSMQRSKYEW